jgi:hypothetical protein
VFSSVLKKGFFDELRKIAAISLHGLSPETLLNQKPPEPMETPGSRKAMDAIDLATAKKTASITSPGLQLRSSQKVGEPVTTRAKKGPSIKQQIHGSLIGRKGALPPQ